MSVKEYIKYLQSIEEYSFSLNELLYNCNKTEIAIKRELSRLVTKKEILNIRRGFYLIIPPRYSKQMILPIQLFIDKFFKHLARDYYVGFYSASKFHGASHQQIHKDYIMTTHPINVINKNSIDIEFLTSTKWPPNNILNKKSDAGMFKISSRSLTAVDLIHYQNKLGGLNRMLENLKELSEEITQSDISKLLNWYPHRSTLQRLGYLLEEFKANEVIIKQIKEYLDNFKLFPVLLSPKRNEKPGAVNNYWKVDVNIKLENE